MGSAVAAIGGSKLKGLAGGLLGSGDSAGVLGTGQYRAKEYDIDENGFKVDGLNSYNQEQDSRLQQNNLAQTLTNQMNGTGPSLAQGQLRQATDRNISQQMGMAAAQRGVNPALAARLAQNNVASMNQQAASDSSQIRAQEQMAAQQQLGGVLTQQRTGDLAATDRDLSAKMGKESLAVQQQSGLNSANQAGYADAAARRGNMISNIGGGAASMLSDENMKQNISSGAAKAQAFLDSLSGLSLGIKDQNKKVESTTGIKDLMGKLPKSGGGEVSAASTMGGSAAGANAAATGGAAAMFSDEKMKTDVHGGGDKMKNFLNAIEAHSYKYKDEAKGLPGAGEGEFVSPMAQELEKTPVGDSLVVDTPEGKMVDYGKAGGVMMAALATLNERTNDLEKMFKTKREKKGG